MGPADEMDEARLRAQELCEQRQAARASRDFQRADELRDEVRELGYIITDTADGPVLSLAPPFTMHERALADGSALGAGARVLIPLLLEGWRDDADQCVKALLQHEQPDSHIVLVDIGDVDGIGLWAQSVADAHADRVSVVHLPASAAHWARIHTDLIERCASDYYCVLDPSSIVSGPAVGALCDVLSSEPEVLLAGWRGADVDTGDQWRSVTAADGEVDVVLSYLLVMRTETARAIPPHPKASFYRNADIEWCLALRERGLADTGVPAKIRALGDALPVDQARHHGYHDSEPTMRDRESRKTYDRILQRFRGRTDILRPRGI